MGWRNNTQTWRALSILQGQKPHSIGWCGRPLGRRGWGQLQPWCPVSIHLLSAPL